MEVHVNEAALMRVVAEGVPEVETEAGSETGHHPGRRSRTLKNGAICP